MLGSFATKRSISFLIGVLVCASMVVALLSYAPGFAYADIYIPQPSGNMTAQNEDDSPETSTSNVATIQEERDPAESTAASRAQTTDKSVRGEEGVVSQLATDKHNPYNGQIRLNIDIGSEFATFSGSDVTEGIIMKVTPGGEVSLPAVNARDGYYFVGWCQGGVPQEPTWDLFTDSVEITDDTSEGKNMTIYALFASENGDGFCTCGAWKSGVYSEQMEKIRADSAVYDAEHGFDNDFEPAFSLNDKTVTFVILFGIALYLLLLFFASKTMSKWAEFTGK